MVESLPKIDPNGLYSPKKTREILEIGKSTLYRYDSDGYLQHEFRPENGRRAYRGRSIISFFKGCGAGYSAGGSDGR